MIEWGHIVSQCPTHFESLIETSSIFFLHPLPYTEALKFIISIIFLTITN